MDGGWVTQVTYLIDKAGNLLLTSFVKLELRSLNTIPTLTSMTDRGRMSSHPVAQIHSHLQIFDLVDHYATLSGLHSSIRIEGAPRAYGHGPA